MSFLYLMSWTVQTVSRKRREDVVRRLRKVLSTSLIAATVRSATELLAALLIILFVCTSATLNCCPSSSKDIEGIFSSILLITDSKFFHKALQAAIAFIFCYDVARPPKSSTSLFEETDSEIAINYFLSCSID